MFGTVGAVFGVALHVFADELDEPIEVVNEAVEEVVVCTDVVRVLDGTDCVEEVEELLDPVGEDELIDAECASEEEVVELGDEFAEDIRWVVLKTVSEEVKDVWADEEAAESTVVALEGSNVGVSTDNRGDDDAKTVVDVVVDVDSDKDGIGML